MSSLHVTILGCRDLKNVNWKNGPLASAAVVWVASSHKLYTRIDSQGDTSPQWDQSFTIPLPPAPIGYLVLNFEVIHAGPDAPLVGSAQMKLHGPFQGFHTLDILRPTGRPHGTINFKVWLRESSPHRTPTTPLHTSDPLPRQKQGSDKLGDLPPFGWQPTFHGSPVTVTPPPEPKQRHGSNEISSPAVWYPRFPGSSPAAIQPVNLGNKVVGNGTLKGMKSDDLYGEDDLSDDLSKDDPTPRKHGHPYRQEMKESCGSNGSPPGWYPKLFRHARPTISSANMGGRVHNGALGRELGGLSLGDEEEGYSFSRSGHMAEDN